MFEKCIPCKKIGVSCVPNLMLLSFPELIRWCIKRQKHLEWTNKDLEKHSKVPVGTINRIWGGDYADCKYSTIRSLLIALIGGTTDEFSCTDLVEKELQHMEVLEHQAEKLSAVEAENQRLKERLRSLDELHRQDIRAIKAEYQEQISFLKEELIARRHQPK